MKTSQTMYSVINGLARKHGLDLSTAEAHMRLDMRGFNRLVVERVGHHQVSVAHYYEQNGELIADPEIQFFTGVADPQHSGQQLWVPVAIQQVRGGYQRVAELNAEGTRIVRLNAAAQANVAVFANSWARSIRHQGWLERGVKYE